MTRRKKVPQPLIQQVVENLERTSIILAAVSQYQELRPLNGVSFDLDAVEEIFISNDDVSFYKESKPVILENSTSSQFRKEILQYSVDRSARGDILILYFSGHGAVLKDGGFAFCFEDTRLGYEGNGVLPLSVVTFRDVAITLASVDVHPMFIIDACFSGSTAPQGYSQIVGSMQSEIQSVAPQSYSLLASASPVSVSIDSPEGGGFTQALYSVILNGLSDSAGRQFPLLSLEQLISPLQEELSLQGHPLPKSHKGRYFPPIAITKNPEFRPDTEAFTPYMKGIVEFLWNGGFPIEASIADIGKHLGYTSYANHRKLSLEPWSLLEDGDVAKTRRLSERGKKFAYGRVSIPKRLIRDPLSWNWIQAPGTDRIKISDV